METDTDTIQIDIYSSLAKDHIENKKSLFCNSEFHLIMILLTTCKIISYV